MSAFQLLKCLLLLAPFFILAIFSGIIYDDIRTNDVPDTVPLQARLRAGQGIMAVFGNLGLIWNFFELLPAAYISSAATLLLISCVDFLIGLFLLLAAGLQSTYLPHTLQGCQSADTWGEDPSTNVTNLFRFAAGTDGGSAADKCHTYMTVYIIGIVLGAASLMSSYGALREARNPPSGRRRRGTRSPGIDVVGGLLNLIPRFLTTPIKFSVRWSQKWWQQSTSRKVNTMTKLETTSEISLAQYPTRLAPVARQYINHSILELFSSYPIMTAIAGELHYVDLINLSLVSRGIFEAIFPAANPAAVANIRMHSCLWGTKSTCWCCNIQTCIDPAGRVLPSLRRNFDQFCSFPRVVRPTMTRRHLWQCAPYCTKCFRTNMCKAAGPRELSQHCSCTSHSQTVIQEVCQSCSKLPQEQVSLKVEAREQREITVKAAQQLNCSDCQKKLPESGPRWWGCMRCGRECRSSLHPQWTETVAP